MGVDPCLKTSSRRGEPTSCAERLRAPCAHMGSRIQGWHRGALVSGGLVARTRNGPGSFRRRGASIAGRDWEVERSEDENCTGASPSPGDGRDPSHKCSTAENAHPTLRWAQVSFWLKRIQHLKSVAPQARFDELLRLEAAYSGTTSDANNVGWDVSALGMLATSCGLVLAKNALTANASDAALLFRPPDASTPGREETARPRRKPPRATRRCQAMHCRDANSILESWNTSAKGELRRVGGNRGGPRNRLAQQVRDRPATGLFRLSRF